MNKKKIFILSIPIFILCSLGLFQIGIITHEVTHVIQAENPLNICYSFSNKTIAYVSYVASGTGEENIIWKDYSEKWASYLEVIVVNIFAIFGGIILTLIHYESKKLNNNHIKTMERLKRNNEHSKSR